MILVLTGPVHSGKTSLLENLVRELSEQGVTIEGFLSLAVFRDGEHIGYDLLDLKEHKTRPYIRKEGEPNWERVGPHFFIPEGLETAKKMIWHHREDSVLVVDEAGPLELQGRGLWPALRDTLSNPSLRCLLVVRRNVLGEFRKLLGQIPLKVIHIEDMDAPGLFRNEILKSASAE
jgi:nucleoside-triphosphatase THEP1